MYDSLYCSLCYNKHNLNNIKRVDIHVGKLITTSSQRVEYLECLHDNKHK